MSATETITTSATSDAASSDSHAAASTVAASPSFSVASPSPHPSLISLTVQAASLASTCHEPRFAHLTRHMNETVEMDEKLGDVPIKEPEFTEEEIKLMEELRSNVAAMIRDPALMTCTSSDNPNGMDVHWTTIWPEGANHPLYADHISQQHADPSQWPQHELIRFLRARDMNLKKATKMFHNYIRWRLTFGASHLATFPTMPFLPLIRSILCDRYHKWDKHGRPLYIQRSGLIDPERFAREVAIAKISVGHTWFHEECAKRMEVGSKLVGRRVTQLVNIIDVAGLGFSARKMLKIFGATTYIDQNYYPETLATLYLINCPSFFPWFWSLAKAFLAPATQAKVRILGKDFQKTLVDELGAECLPVEYGGTCSCPGGCCPPPDSSAKSIDGVEKETITIKAGATQTLELPVVGESDDVAISNGDASNHASSPLQELFWTVELASKDIGYTAEFRPSPPTENADEPSISGHESSQKHASDDANVESNASTPTPQPPASASTSSTPSAALPAQIIQPATRIDSTAPVHGSFSSRTPGLVVLTFDNTFSRWNSKTVTVTSGMRDTKKE